jgi:FecR protein
MTFRTYLRFAIIFVFALSLAALQPVYTEAGNVRIIRLSLVQGDVRILHDSKGDPLANNRAPWERAELNLPIRRHDVLATDNGRAEVEFENGAMAFINENTVLEFFALSLDDGTFTTRLILRQGSASFYANPSSADYFSVTGGDFTAEAGSRANFRMDNFDDGSTIAVSKGRVSVVRKDDSSILNKGESLTMHAGDDSAVVIGRAPASDDFDRWVSGRADSVVTATNAALQYSNSSSYRSGFGDLYSYGGFYPLSGFGYGWQPYGVGIGWSPFDSGDWFFQSGLGWSFIGNQPWGWLPYHYGGWIFEPGIGWLWAPTGFGRGLPPVKFHPVTATFVRSGNTVAMIPSHPLDTHGKTPLNLAHGIMPVTTHAGAGVDQSALAANTKWKVVKEPPSEVLTSHVSASTSPARLTRTVNSSATAASAAGSAIVYDAKEHRFVNGNAPASSAAKASGPSEAAKETSAVSSPGASGASGVTSASGRAVATTSQARVVAPPSASSRVAPPPPVSRTSMGSSRERTASLRTTTTQAGSTTSSLPAPAPRASSTSRSH